MKPFTLKNLDWPRMLLFVVGAFLTAVGLAGMSHQALWPAVCLAFWQSVWFVGGFCQNPAKVEQELEDGTVGAAEPQKKETP